MFRIGDFSKFSHVSVRMLRHYDELGLLKPARVDPQTEYRYYSADQLPRLHRILTLQDLGFSLDQIGKLLARRVSADEMRGMLLLKRADLQNKVDDDLERLARIESRIDQIEESESPRYDIVLRSVKPIRVAAIRANAEQDFTPLFEELENYVSRFRARGEQPPLALYFGDDSDQGDIAVAVPVKAELEVNDRIEIYELPAVDNMACVVHTGDYETIQLANKALMKWIASNPYEIAGPLREVYYRFGAAQVGYEIPSAYLTDQDEEFVTELQVPVERS
ncbi:MAG TPA: MerR family transcriptional regulator [Anaerolineales bacterium]